MIYIKIGSYKENVEIGSGLNNIMLLGDGMGKIIIIGSKSVGGGIIIFRLVIVGKLKVYIYFFFVLIYFIILVMGIYII